jgi:hypothetical protein
MGFYSSWLFPRVLDLVMQQTQMVPFRKQIGDLADGCVLELGVGSGRVSIWHSMDLNVSACTVLILLRSKYLIAGVEPPYGQTVASLTQFVVEKTSDITVKPYPLKRTGRQEISHFVLGENDAITDYMKRNTTWYEMGSFSRIAKDLIQIEINAKPDIVGPPVSILTIGNRGMQWIDPGVCQQ